MHVLLVQVFANSQSNLYLKSLCLLLFYLDFVLELSYKCHLPCFSEFLFWDPTFFKKKRTKKKNPKKTRLLASLAQALDFELFFD